MEESIKEIKHKKRKESEMNDRVKDFLENLGHGKTIYQIESEEQDNNG